MRESRPWFLCGCLPSLCVMFLFDNFNLNLLVVSMLCSAGLMCERLRVGLKDWSSAHSAMCACLIQWMLGQNLSKVIVQGDFLRFTGQHHFGHQCAGHEDHCAEGGVSQRKRAEGAVWPAQATPKFHRNPESRCWEGGHFSNDISGHFLLRIFHVTFCGAKKINPCTVMWTWNPHPACNFAKPRQTAPAGGGYLN